METGLQHELKQNKPFANLRHEASLNLLRTAALHEHALQEGLKPFGITHTQYNVLRILRGSGIEGLCRNDIRDRMVTPVPDATRLLDRLVDSGYAERSREGIDRRYITARITQKGLDLLNDLDKPLDELNHRTMSALSDSELRQLSDLLTKARLSL